MDDVILCVLLFLSITHSQGLISVQSPLSVDGNQYQYVMKLTLGSPPRELSLIVDTGSDLTWIQCMPCVQCFDQGDPLFDPTLSTTFSTVACNSSLCAFLRMDHGSFHCNGGREECRFTYGYSDGSFIDGEVANEKVSFMSSTPLDLVIGCASNERMARFGDADGIVGLGGGRLSLPSQLSTQSVAHVFSYCLVDVLSRGSLSSQIVFGEAARNPTARFTPMLTSQGSGHYYVGVHGISIGGHRVPAISTSTFRRHASGRGGVLLDSGTSYSQWNMEAFTPMLAAFRQQISSPEVHPTPRGFQLCYNVSGIPKSDISFPAMVVHMTSVDFEIPVQNLFEYIQDKDPIACLTMSTSGDDGSLIGAVQQQNNLVVFDIVNEQRGFMPTHCGSYSW